MEAESTSTLGTAGSLHGAITLASDANGVEVKLCPVSASPAPMVVLCVGQPSLGCDVNEDGRTDIRDLVRMIGCLVPELADSSGDRRCPDCDGNGVFQLDDLFCCATQILRGSGLPGDSARVQQGLSIGMDPVEDMGGLYRVRVHMRGTASLSAALLRVRYPADRWRVVPPPASLDPIVPEGWLPLDDVSEPGIARLGALRLVPQASDELHYTLFLERVAGTAGGGEIRVDGADLTLPDGAVVRPAAALPSEPLAPSLLPVTIALSPARPNPFGSATSFVVSFPRAAQAELAIHDLAGRRVATLFQGRIEAGSRTFQWDGTGARDGVYFARLTVEGRVYTSRVALLKNGR
jgi:hypothetical protein